MRFWLATSCLYFSLHIWVATASKDYYFWNYALHPYQTYYLEDYCGPVEGIDCASEAHTVYLNETGSGSGLVIRGFRAAKPSIERSLRCCIQMKTTTEGRFNVQLDEIYLKERKIGERCDNYLRFKGLEEELLHVCSEVEKYSFKTAKNVLGIEYVLNSDNAPNFQKIKVVVTSSIDVDQMQSGRCNPDKEQWQCDDGGCIWDGFRCDAHNNCGDWSDELYCGFFSRYWTVFLGIACGLFVALLIWCVCRCCCCCCPCKRSRMNNANKPFLYVTTLGPNGRPMPEQNLYPSLSVPYQNAPPARLTPLNLAGAPPPYNENAFLSPAQNPTYGTSSKS
ncbi:uncharacterized protein LOC100899841 isoform X2 [Galendromus occidentalis]|uniref:Uncharacterized protein LOC100899841 isoform X2 n=1 Tax=Galendromus occidentalis TaxID=34638 RepID=A0AAJ7L5R2_9ACAR|nr:uncharacterized protein LOC100899841 isoform X2 [Galendromus occidentalis]